MSWLACSDDDAAVHPAMRDAGPALAGKPDAHMDAAVDGARPDKPKDGSVDAGDAGREVCAHEGVPHWEGTFRAATRVSLAVYCDNLRCPASLAAFSSKLSCTDANVDAGQDHDDAGAGICLEGSNWVRREGCGQVEFDVPPCDYARDLNFDANTGALLGAARTDDIGVTLRGTSCVDAAYVAGKLLTGCASETRSLCVRKP